MPERPAGAGLYWAASSDRRPFAVKHHACQADWSRLTRMQVVQQDASADMRAGESIGQRLRRLRLEKGLSQRELAGPGVSYAYVSRIEGGQRRPSLRAIRVLARKLGVSAQYLETGSMTTSEEEREIRLSDAELRLRLDESVAGAEAAFHEVLREAREAGDIDAEIRAELGLGLASARAGRNEEAVEHLERSIDSPRVSPTSHPDVYITLGNTYLDLDRPEQAAELYERCLDELSAQAEDDTTARVRFGTHLSYALSNLGRFVEAREVLNDLTSRAGAIVDPYARIRLYWSLARLAAMEGHGRTALRHLRRAIALLEATEDTLRRATESLRLTGDAPLGSAHFALAQAHALRGEVEEANCSFRTAVELLDQGGDWREAVQACRAWAEVLREAGRTGEAFEGLEQAADLAEKASAAPLHLALRRLRARLFVVAATAAAVGGAGALVGWSSLAAAHAQERNVHLRLRALSPAKRAVRVVYTTAPLDGDRYAETVRRALARLRDVTEPPRLVRVWHPLAPADERGTRVVVAGRPRRDVEVDAGRLPRACTSDLCEGLSLAGRHRIGERVRLGSIMVLIVGRGSLDPAALADRSLLGQRALLLRSVPRSLRLFARTRVGTSIVLTALADRGDVARRRLLFVASEGAALVLAFAAFTATARRREVAALEEQLATLGVSRGQIWLARAAEALVPSAAGLT